MKKINIFIMNVGSPHKGDDNGETGVSPEQMRMHLLYSQRPLHTLPGWVDCLHIRKNGFLAQTGREAFLLP